MIRILWTLMMTFHSHEKYECCFLIIIDSNSHSIINYDKLCDFQNLCNYVDYAHKALTYLLNKFNFVIIIFSISWLNPFHVINILNSYWANGVFGHLAILNILPEFMRAFLYCL